MKYILFAVIYATIWVNSAYCRSILVGENLKVSIGIIQDSKSLLVSCTRARKESRIMVCKNKNYEGILYGKEDALSMTPFVMASQNPSYIPEFTVLYDENEYFISWSDVGNFNDYIIPIGLALATEDNENYITRKNYDFVENSVRKLSDEFNCYLTRSISTSISQKISIFNGIIYSFLTQKNLENNSNNSINSQEKEVSLEEAKNIFNEFYLRSDLSFKYTNDGCYARAHLVADELNKRGIKTAKIWVKGQVADPGQSKKTWDYHVAALISAKDVGYLVIDPSPTIRELLAIEDWLKLMIKDQQIPQQLNYPLPKNIEPFYKNVYCLSSHEVLWPYSCAVEIDHLEYLKEAKETNHKYLTLIN